MSTPNILTSDKTYTIHYVSGVEKVTPIEYAINSIIFELVTMFKMPLLSKYSVTNYYVNGFLNKNSIVNAYKSIYKDILMNIPLTHDSDAESIITNNIMNGMNRIYNDIALESKEFETTVTLKEILDIQLQPDLLKVINQVEKTPTPKAIKDVYSTLRAIMFKEEHRSNKMVQSYLAETVSSRQTHHCLGVIGFQVDLKNKVYQVPVATSYALGLNKIEDVAKESRGGAIALKNSTEAITKSETFARETQMLTGVVTTLERTDCGSEVGIAFHVKAKTDTFQGDLKGIVGLMYKLSEDDKWKTISEEDTFLVNKTIIIRTALSCQLKSSTSICIACYGRTGHIMPKGFNVGHFSCSKMNEPAAQLLLSTKHHNESADGGEVKLSPEESRYFTIDKTNTIKLKLNLREWKSVYILVPEVALKGLKNIRNKNSLLSAEIWNISHLKEFTLELTKHDGTIIFQKVVLTRNLKIGIFSSEFIAHILDKGYSLEKKEYRIHMKGFNMRKAIIHVPDTVFDSRKYNDELTNILRTLKGKDGTTIKSADQLLKTLFNFINIKLFTHMSHLSVIAYALTAANKAEGDYSLTRGIDAPVATLRAILGNRTLSVTLSYGKADAIYKGLSTINDDSEAHLLTSLYLPEDALKDIS